MDIIIGMAAVRYREIDMEEFAVPSFYLHSFFDITS